MYIQRIIEDEVIKMSKEYPVLTITGPRQSGKTTLSRHLFGNLPYYNFENPDTRFMVSSDPRAFLNNIDKGAILDEIQNIPELISYLQQIADERRSEITFILTGSNQLLLIDKVTQSLAGRTAILKLLPLGLSEIGPEKSLPTSDLMLRGFYPGVYAHKLNPYKAYRNYYETYLERDLRKITQIKDLQLFQKFVRICAGRISNLVNASAIANETGVSVGTVKSWMSMLEASYIAYFLPPYFENFGKRYIKAPKIYFYDVGLAAFLLGIENTTQLDRDPLRGALFENMIVSEFMKNRFNKGLDSNLFFYHDSHHNEIDIVIKHGNLLQPVEIKSSQTFHPDFIKQFNHFLRTFPNSTVKPVLIYDGITEQKVQEVEVINFRNLESTSANSI
ncbi:MAG TPA: ATP-binding protein [Bacteroidales bacterium]|nr:ATP-binding protein [Bacteroidales bacterium]HNS46667.1 ATP-binding protein [Bacteroidales bacterium]